VPNVASFSGLSSSCVPNVASSRETGNIGHTRRRQSSETGNIGYTRRRKTHSFHCEIFTMRAFHWKSDTIEKTHHVKRSSMGCLTCKSAIYRRKRIFLLLLDKDRNVKKCN
jgi:hypothetical protein